jgi:D-xylose transport system permease protein
VVTLGLFLGFQGLALVIIGPGGLYRLEVPELIALQNGNLPVWGGWLMLGVMLLISGGTSYWDRARRARAGVPNRAVSLVWIKLAVIAVLGGTFVFILNQNRGQSAANAVEGVPIIVPVVLVILWIGTFVLDRTKFGRYIYAIGGNAEAARRSGVKVRWIKWWAFVICSALAVMAALLSVARVGSVDATVGRDIVLSGVAAAVVGGVSLFGGRGRLVHAAIGAMVIAVITNGLALLNLPAGINLLVTGAVLIMAATVDAVSRLRSGGART